MQAKKKLLGGGGGGGISASAVPQPKENDKDFILSLRTYSTRWEYHLVS